jgi:hypothetical protein
LKGALNEGVTGHRPGAARDRVAAQGQSRRQVRRVSWRRRRFAFDPRPRHHRQHGARIRRDDGLFPVDEESCKYMLATGRSPELVDTFRSFYQAQGMFGMPRGGDIEYSQLIELDLNDVQPGVAGPKRPQDRINLPEIKERFIDLFQKPVLDGGYNKR